VLKGSFPVDGSSGQREKHAGKVAIVQLIVLPDPGRDQRAKAAMAHILDGQKDPERGNFPKTTLTFITDKNGEEQDRQINFGQLRGRLLKLRMANTEDRVRFVAMGLVNRPGDKLLLIYCECDWALRDYWDLEFTNLLSSFKAAKGSPAQPIQPKSAPAKLS
jgi:hypothetical protein